MGAGKSTALGALERLGAATLSTDAVVHELYETAEVRDLVVARWGEDVAPGGVVDRAAIAARVFAAPDERAWLEGELWPRVARARRRVSRRGARAHAAAPVAAVVETPLLFEAGMDGIYDATIAVVADEDVRLARAEGRGHVAHAASAPRASSRRTRRRSVRRSSSTTALPWRISNVSCLTCSPH